MNCQVQRLQDPIICNPELLLDPVLVRSPHVAAHDDMTPPVLDPFRDSSNLYGLRRSRRSSALPTCTATARVADKIYVECSKRCRIRTSVNMAAVRHLLNCKTAKVQESQDQQDRLAEVTTRVGGNGPTRRQHGATADCAL